MRISWRSLRRAVALAALSLGIAMPVTAQSFSTSTLPKGGDGNTNFVPGPNSITQSLDPSTITQFNSVSCNAGGIHTDNSYIRRFFLELDHGIIGQFDVTDVDFGVEVSNPNGATQPVDVNLYTIPVGSPLVFANLTPIGSTSLNVGPEALTILNAVVTGTVADPTTQDLVVEIFTPSGQAAGHSFFVGSNPNGQTQPTYLAAAACGVSEPTPTGSIGFPDMHMVMIVNGIEAGGVPTLPNWAMLALLIVLLAIPANLLRRRHNA